MKFWLMKSEPDIFGIKHLKAQTKTPWEGVRNYQARNFMRDEMKIKDKILFYHSSCAEPGVAGLATVVSKPYPDQTQFDNQSPYYDPKSTSLNPRWFLIDVGFVKEFSEVLTLKRMKEFVELTEMKVLQKGNRLSIMPVEEQHYNTIIKLMG